MKYTDYSQNNSKKAKKSLYAVLVGCIAVLAIVTRITAGNDAKKTTPDKKNISSSQSGSAYNDSKKDNSVSSPVEQKVDSEPYSEPAKAEVKENSTASKPAAQTFVSAVDGTVAKGYSDTELQYSKTFDDMRLHTGVDIAAAKGSKIKSVSSGKVTNVENSLTTGKTVTIDHGTVTVKYCGLSTVNIAAGDTVNAGDTIGLLGDIPFECADSTHLHLEVYKDSAPISPNEILNIK